MPRDHRLLTWSGTSIGGRIKIRGCLPWLEAEIELIKPEVLVCLGATAAKSLIAPSFSVMRQRGQFVESELAPHVTATIHPSAVLRRPSDTERRAEMRRLIADFERVGRVLDGG